jgi:glycosidase
MEKSGLGLIDLHNQQSGQIGTADDFGKLVEEARRLGCRFRRLHLTHGLISSGLRVLIDFPLVVASTAHPWFDRSALAARPENFAFADFFYWRRGPIPNNKTEEVNLSPKICFYSFHVPPQSIHFPIFSSSPPTTAPPSNTST